VLRPTTRSFVVQVVLPDTSISMTYDPTQRTVLGLSGTLLFPSQFTCPTTSNQGFCKSCSPKEASSIVACCVFVHTYCWEVLLEVTSSPPPHSYTIKTTHTVDKTLISHSLKLSLTHTPTLIESTQKQPNPDRAQVQAFRLTTT
jgi:hypothetical protein